MTHSSLEKIAGRAGVSSRNMKAPKPMLIHQLKPTIAKYTSRSRQAFTAGACYAH